MKRNRIIIVVACTALAILIGAKIVTHQSPAQQCASALVTAEQQDHNTGDVAGIRSAACQSLSNADYLTAHHLAEQQLGEVIP